MLIFLLSLALPGQADARCLREMLDHYFPLSEQLSRTTVNQVQSLLGRKINSLEKGGLFRELRDIGVPITRNLALDGKLLRAQGRRLREDGFSGLELESLRTAGILPRFERVLKGGAKDLSVAQLPKLIDPAVDEMEKLAKARTLFYFEDMAGNVHFTRKKIDFDPDTHPLLQSAEDPQVVYQPKAMGEVRWDSKSNHAHFVTKYSLGLAPEEMAEFRLKMRKKLGREIEVETPKGRGRSKLIDCLMARNGKGTMMPYLAGAAVVFGGAVGANELMGAGRFDTQRGREMLTADSINHAKNDVVFALMGSVLADPRLAATAALVGRGVVGLGLLESDRFVTKNVLSESAEERSNAVRNYDLGWLLFRLPTAHYTDRFFKNRLPDLLFRACLKGGAGTRIFLSPTALRIYEQSAVFTIYLGARKTFVDE
jgi:hypothetical protein